VAELVAGLRIALETAAFKRTLFFSHPKARTSAMNSENLQIVFIC
jgi:hypothetical protein